MAVEKIEKIVDDFSYIKRLTYHNKYDIIMMLN